MTKDVWKQLKSIRICDTRVHSESQIETVETRSFLVMPRELVRVKRLLLLPYWFRGAVSLCENMNTLLTTDK